MKHLWLIAVGGLIAAPALAQEASADAGVRESVLQALEERATLPAQPPRLPDAASDRAREVHATTAFGQKGEAERAAHELAGKRADDHARRVNDQAVGDGNHGAAAEAKKANADTRAAAARDRSDQAKGHDNGHGNPGGHRDPNPPGRDASNNTPLRPATLPSGGARVPGRL